MSGSEDVAAMASFWPKSRDGQRERSEHRAEDRHALADFGGQPPGRFDGDARPGIAGHGVGEGADVGGAR